MCDNFNEVNIFRTLENYYRNRAHDVEQNICPTEKPEPDVVVQKKGSDASRLSEILWGTDVLDRVFIAITKIAIEIGQEGREGHKIGTAFVIGDSEKVMKSSRQLILNPFQGHSREKRMVTEAETQDTIKEFAQLDGIFVVSGDGAIEAAGRYITIDTGIVKLQRGLGTRHLSVAAITMATHSIGVVVSQSGGVIRIFKEGKIVATLKS
jgi:diadenylate cyclase